METRNNPRDLVLLAGAALLSAGAIAMPLREQTVTQSEVVKYSVPDSTTPEGAKRLYRKLQTAAIRVCSIEYPPKGYFPDSTCIENALSKAVTDVGIPQVAALHLQKHAGSKVAGANKTSPTERDTFARR